MSAKILGFRRSKKAKITLENLNFLRNISISIFKFTTLLDTMKACRWNFINFWKSTNALIRKEKSTHTTVIEKEKLRINVLYFITGCFLKTFKIIIIFFLLFCKLIRSAIFAFCYQDNAKNIKMRNSEWQIAKNGKLQYLFQE